MSIGGRLKDSSGKIMLKKKDNNPNPKFKIINSFPANDYLVSPYV